MFRLGLLINPIAGLGGPAGLKGSDHPDTQRLAQERGVNAKAHARVRQALSVLEPVKSQITLVLARGSMGLEAEHLQGWNCEFIFDSPEPSKADDSLELAKTLHSNAVDLLLFAGGDGTARDVYQALGESQAVLGLPAGVKMHSGVFAVNPNAAASIIQSLMKRRLVAARLAEVRDIDEQAFAEGRVKTRYFGEMLVPDDQLLVQGVKCSGLQDDELMLEELSVYVAEMADPEAVYVLGSGGTMLQIKQAMGIDKPTLLGVDICLNGVLLARDVHEQQLFELLQGYDECHLLLSVIGGQGIVLGRGNQQLSPRVLEHIGLQNIQFVSTQQKIQALSGQPLRVDSGSTDLDEKLTGYHKILCGYEDAILYPIEGLL